MRILAFLFLSVLLLSKSSDACTAFHEDESVSIYIPARRILHDPEKVKQFSLGYDNKFGSVESQFEVEGNHGWDNIPTGWHLIFESHREIVQDQNVVLYTAGVQECIGITVWDPESKTAALLHATCLYLSEARADNVFKNLFIDKLKEKIKDFSRTQVNLISCYWSSDALLAIDLLLSNGIPISGLRIPQALLLRDQEKTTRYINPCVLPLKYKEGDPAMAIALNTATGEIGFKLY